MGRVSEKVGNWLETKLANQEHGIILDHADLSSFNFIQDFLEAKDHLFKTTVIYYNAFAEEGVAEFLNTLQEELSSKLGSHKLKSDLTLPEVIANAGLKMMIIDQSYLHPWETTDELFRLLTDLHVALILVGSAAKMHGSKILSHPEIAQWDRLVVNEINMDLDDLDIVNQISQPNHLSVSSEIVTYC
jgi:hypothetical protein